VVLECQALLGLVMPGDSLVQVGGFFAEQGTFAVIALEAWRWRVGVPSSACLSWFCWSVLAAFTWVLII
jgi:hypothetical protein